MSIRETLNRLGFEPKKSLGQNFMIDESALNAMVDSAGLDAAATVLEVGPGLGTLTARLADAAGRVVALELDDRALPHLRATFAGQPHVEIVHGDILEADLAGIMAPNAQDYRVVANLPYYITSAVIRHLLESDTPPARMVITVQKEVAERITAAPGDMSLLAVSVQVYGSPSIVRKLKPGSFYPRPSIDSAILRVDPFETPRITSDERKTFFRVARAGFHMPRKQIKNCLSAGLHVPSAEAVGWLETVGIDPRRRAETLAVDEWLALHRVVFG